MSTKHILIIILFMNIIIPVLLEDGEIDYSKHSISNLQSSFFKYQKEQIYYLDNFINNLHIIAFSDLNNDKLTDIITYRISSDSTVFSFYVHYYSNKDEPGFSKENFLFNITINETINDEDNNPTISIRNVYIGSLFNDKKLCFLVSFNKGDKSLLHYVVCGEINSENTIKFENPVKLDIYSNILIMNRNETSSTQLLYYSKDEGKRKICILNKQKDNYGCSGDDTNFEDFLLSNKTYANKPLSLTGGLGYVDISGNCVPDIILSHEEDNNTIIEIYESSVNDYRYTLNSVIKLGNSSEYGAFVITKINDEKDDKKAPLLGLLIPKIYSNEVIYLKNNREIEYDWATYMCEIMNDYKCDEKSNKNCKKLFDEDIKNAKKCALTIEGPDKGNVTLDNTFPTVIRVGDFLGTSNPGLIVKQNINDGESQISLFERKDGNYKYYAGITIEKISGMDKDDKFKMGLFFDIDETGTLSLILPTEKGKNLFFFNYRSNIYFLKSKLMNDKKLFYDTNLGATFRYIVTDKKGDRHMDISYQMAQTSDMNIPLPYSLMGLDDTNNYVEYFETISGNYIRKKDIFLKTDENNRKGNSPIIPNTQMMISKFYNAEKKYEWNVDLIVQPMEQIWLFLIIVIVVLLIVLGFIIYLHVKELKEEQKETTKFKSWFA